MGRVVSVLNYVTSRHLRMNLHDHSLSWLQLSSNELRLRESRFTPSAWQTSKNSRRHCWGTASFPGAVTSGKRKVWAEERPWERGWVWAGSNSMRAHESLAVKFEGRGGGGWTLLGYRKLSWESLWVWGTRFISINSQHRLSGTTSGQTRENSHEWDWVRER